MAGKMPRWVNSDMLTAVGSFGALLTGLGYVLTALDIRWLWLSSFGLLVNWFGDSLDGTLARVRNCQRPIYGYYLDHTMDCICEAFMFIGAGLSPLLRMDIAMAAYILYLLMTVNVAVNAHLRSEFKLTYAKLGPTEFRLIIIIVNTLYILVRPLTEYTLDTTVLGRDVTLTTLDVAMLGIVALLLIIYLVTVVNDIRYYAKVDPRKAPEEKLQ